MDKLNKLTGVSRRSFLQVAALGTVAATVAACTRAMGLYPATSLAEPLSPLDEPVLRDLFEKAVKQSGAYGAQLSLIKAGQQLDFAAGTANTALNQPMTTDTLIQIGSVTKVFNAMIVACLVEEGLLDLDVPVKHYLPALAVADAKASRTITLRHLLSMSSGLDNGPYVYFGGEEDALARYVANLKTLPQAFEPGRYFGYANAGICIVGHVASVVTGKPWEQLLRERILEPAKLNEFATVESDLLYKRISAGHQRVSDGGRPTIIDPVLRMFRARAPSGASFALTTRDLARFATIFLNKGVSDTGNRVLSESTVDLMMTPQIEVPTRKYGNAWCIGPCSGNWNGVQVWGHGGSTATSKSYLYWIPEYQGAIAFVVNTPSAMGEFSRIMFEDMLDAAFGFRKPRIDVPEQNIAPVDPRRYVGVYKRIGGSVNVKETDAGITADYIREWMGKSLEEKTLLTPLGGDRFLVNPIGGPNEGRGVVDTAFFGDDGTGRATNMLDLVFPMRRVGV